MDVKNDKAVPWWRTIILIIQCYLVFGTPGQIGATECPGRLRSARQIRKMETLLDDNAAWMKDPYQVSDRLYYMGYEQYLTRRLYEYENLENMKNNRPGRFYQTPETVEGTGFVVLDRNLYFTPERTRTIVRFDLSKHKIEKEIELPAANYDGTSPYAIELATDIDLAVDEMGLWAIYATEYNEGNIVISRLKHNDLTIVQKWTTDYYKLSALNAFMVCGVLYAVNYETLTIDYMFNTSSNIGSKVNIPLPGLSNNASTINYNPKDQKLYIWDTKKAITYQLDFEPIIVTTTTTTTTSTTTTSTTTTSTTTQRTASTPSISPFPLRCPERESKGLTWPATNYRGVAQLNCPGSTSGYAHWICGGNVTHPQWTTEEPDFTQCTSRWITEIVRELSSGRSAAVELSQMFAQLLQQQVENRNEIKSWDIVTSVQLLSDFLGEATTASSSAATLTGSILKIASLLLDPYVEESWNALGFSMQNELASDLINTMEDAAFFLAYDISTVEKNPNDASDSTKVPGSDTPTPNKLNWSEKMISLGITVDPVPYPGEISSPVPYYENILWSNGQGNMVKVETNAVVDALSKYDDDVTIVENAGLKNKTTTRHLAVVLLSFENLGQYLKDEQLYRTHLQPVNSKVLSVSAASIKRTTVSSYARRPDEAEAVIVNRHQTLDLAKPVQMTITHDRPDMKHHVCAYWDFSEGSETGQWSRRGCRRVAGNKTHSTCECDHLSSFTVLSSNVPFPLMGFQGGDGVPTEPPRAYPYVARDLPILRAGLALSLFFLLIVAITLFALSISRHLQTDINTIHKNLILSLIATEVVFLCGIDRTLVPNVCGAVAALLHFGLLATFTWAALESYHLMAVLGDITERRDRWRWYYFIGYGLPTIVVAVSAAVDHDGCWLKTDGNFIWSFIGPCCFVIVCCILFLAMTVYRLHLYSANFTDAPKDKSIRSGVARACVLMFLLCALWSCGVLWLSNFEPRVTAILFCTFSSLYGVASFLFYCILPSEVRKCYIGCLFRFSKKSHHGMTRGRHVSNTSQMGRLGSTTTHMGTLGRPEDHSTYGGYYTTATGCTTTLLPVSQAQNGLLSKSAAGMNQSATGINSTMMSSLNNIHHVGQPPMHRGHYSTSDVMEQTDPKVAVNAFTHPYPGSSGQVWAEYGLERVSESRPHNYEQPYPHLPQCSTIASGASGHYNHLHENYPSGSHHHLAACGAGHCPNEGPHHFTPHPHHYETMDLPLCKNCPPGYGIQVRVDGNGEPQAVQYRHCAEDAQHRTVCYTAPRRNRPQDPSTASYPCCDAATEPHCRACVGTMEQINPESYRPCTTMHQGHIVNSCTAAPLPTAVVDTRYIHPNAKPFDSLDSDNSFSARRSQIKMGTSGLGNRGNFAPQRRQRSNNYNKTGRSSDPLSTDQGYDTDSQQQGGGAQSDTDQPNYSRSASGPKPTLIVRSVENSAPLGTRLRSVVESTSASEDNTMAGENPGARRARKGASVSDLSDCTSENDLEVERITNLADESASSSPATHEDSGAYDGDDVMSPPTEAPPGFRNHGDEEMIDTECGGRLSVAESVTSWCAHPGSNPRSVMSSYGKNINRNKKTSDPNIILANARKQQVHMRQRDGENTENNQNGQTQNTDNNEQRHNKKYTYTLPGTAATGTKAKIDLKSGGISMITNL